MLFILVIFLFFVNIFIKEKFNFVYRKDFVDEENFV